ncbi:MAG: hypothetical protein FJ397_08180 [Verrucomicrobia bacterium]|nr:hypothetical protein [Verrucomicrobiota bacterium]
MREINLLNINYKPFDAAGWPLPPSGLLGPVTLTPLRRTAPKGRFRCGVAIAIEPRRAGPTLPGMRVVSLSLDRTWKS